jgi:hypothetical protein
MKPSTEGDGIKSASTERGGVYHIRSTERAREKKKKIGRLHIENFFVISVIQVLCSRRWVAEVQSRVCTFFS